jgi:hypothetical protein
MPKKQTYHQRWGLDPVPINPEEIKAAVNVPSDLGIKLSREQKKRWGEIVSHLAWRLKLGAAPGQAAVDQMLREIDTGIEQMLPALETVQNPIIKRVFAVRRKDDPEKLYPLPPHLHARNISRLIALLKEWKLTCRVELAHRKTQHKKGRPSDSSLDTAILNIGQFYREATGKSPTVYRTQHSQKRSIPASSKLFAGEFLEITLETLLALRVPGVRESARNALAERIERMKPDLVA